MTHWVFYSLSDHQGLSTLATENLDGSQFFMSSELFSLLLSSHSLPGLWNVTLLMHVLVFSKLPSVPQCSLYRQLPLYEPLSHEFQPYEPLQTLISVTSNQ